MPELTPDHRLEPPRGSRPPAAARPGKPSESGRRRETTNHRRSARRAFTLLELLLVMGMLVMLAALSWPALRGPLAGQRLRAAGRVVRSELAKGRLAAIRSGEIYRGRIVAAEGRLEIAPWQSEAALGELPAAARGRLRARPASDDESQPAARLPVYTAVLPEGIAIVAGGQELPPVEATDPPGSDAEVDAHAIWFYPDGTTSDAGLTLRSTHGQQIDLTLRGITGAVDVGRPYMAGE